MDTSSVWEEDFSSLPQRRGSRVVGQSFWDMAPAATTEDLPRAVYVIGPEGGPYKVGMSYHPEQRAAELGGLRLWGALDVADPRRVERIAHEILAAKALGGERFACTLAEAVEAVTKAAALAE